MDTEEAGEPSLPARMLNEFAYCPRLFYLEAVEREWADSADTVEGRLHHRRVDEAGGRLPEPSEGESASIHARSVLLESSRLRLVARIDLVELAEPEGTVAPVDYKHGAVPPTPEASWEPERVQLCAQGLLLREHGFRCDYGVIYYVASRRRVVVPFTEELIERTLALRDAALATAEAPHPPPPLVDSRKCPRCSLVGICLPDETNLLRTEEGLDADQQLTTAPEGQQRVRRLFASRADALPFYVQKQGAYVRRSGERLLVTYEGATEQEVRLMDISQLCLVGNVQITAQALKDVASRGIAVCHMTTGGWLSALTTGVATGNVELRRRQFRAADEPDVCLEIGRRIVSAKILNSRVLLRRNHRHGPSEVLRGLRGLTMRAREAGTQEELLGIEGAAARLYFSAFSGMLRENMGFDFETRNRRPPRDAVNAMLSFGYSLLLKDWVCALQSVGFDPYMGFYHRPRWRKPALALDMMEEFRPIIVDSVVVSAINRGEIGPSDFLMRGFGVALTDRGRRAFIEAYEKRLDVEVRHPIFGYSVSYRRVFEIQARLLARCVMGEIKEYPAFVVR